MSATNTISSAVGRLIAGAMVLTGTAAAGPLAATAGTAAGTATGLTITGPAAAGILGVMAMFAAGTTIIKGRKSDQGKEQIDRIETLLIKLLTEHGSLAAALGALSDEQARMHGVDSEQLRVLRDVFTGGINGLHYRLQNYPKFTQFVEETMRELEANDEQFRIALSGLIDLAIENKSISQRHLEVLNGLDEKLEGVTNTQEKHTAVLDEIRATVTEIRCVVTSANPTPKQRPVDSPVPDHVQERLDEAKALIDVDKYTEAIPLLLTHE